MKSRPNFLALMSAICLAAAFSAGCRAATPTAAPATDPPLTQWSDVSTPVQPTQAPTATGQANFEPTASAVGNVPYSGYTCSFNADGCSCDDAAIIKAAFTFESGDKMTYAFRGDTYAASWEMSRLGANQWGFTIPVGADQNGGTPAPTGHFFTVLTFTSDGFTLLQREDRGDSTQVTCPLVLYKRLSSATAVP